jgi:hypothetical protein
MHRLSRRTEHPLDVMVHHREGQSIGRYDSRRMPTKKFDGATGEMEP